MPNSVTDLRHTEIVVVNRRKRGNVSQKPTIRLINKLPCQYVRVRFICMDRSFIVYRIAKLDFNTTYRRFSSPENKSLATVHFNLKASTAAAVLSTAHKKQQQQHGKLTK